MPHKWTYQTSSDTCLLYSFHRRNRQFLILVVLWVSGRETVREEYYYMVKHCGESYWHMSHAWRCSEMFSILEGDDVIMWQRLVRMYISAKNGGWDAQVLEFHIFIWEDILTFWHLIYCRVSIDGACSNICFWIGTSIWKISSLPSVKSGDEEYELLVCRCAFFGSWWGDIYIPPTPGSGWGWHWHTLQLYWCWTSYLCPSWWQKMLCLSIITEVIMWSVAVKSPGRRLSGRGGGVTIVTPLHVKLVLVFSAVLTYLGHWFWRDYCSLVFWTLC